MVPQSVLGEAKVYPEDKVQPGGDDSQDKRDLADAKDVDGRVDDDAGDEALPGEEPAEGLGDGHLY